MDIKPLNILLSSNDRIKLTDFGISQKFDSDKTFSVKGTLLYMAPEISKMAKGYNPLLADVYSLGITFYHMSQGKWPFQDIDSDNTKMKIMNSQKFFSTNIDIEFQQIIRKMLNLEPTQRSTISQLINDSLFRKMNLNRISSTKQFIESSHFIHRKMKKRELQSINSHSVYQSQAK
jgi:serine/threonine protein kinase